MLKTVHPKTYDDVFDVGNHFRDGRPVLMDLTALLGSDATPLVDFAAGLVMGCGGALERVAPGVFLLLPEGMSAPGA